MKREPEKVTREKHGKMTEEKSNTTFSEGADPELRRCDSDTYQCLICTKKGSYAKLVSHLQGHQRSMVEYGGKGPTSPTEATRGMLSVNQCNHRGSGHAATP
ncbi:hypothetical protein JOB18_017049 [Solea senegalensis]|uniref:C2H2-type domain-containing protein n=1 Tax=Solea senegalensis TaxID=28829 RepID=A0AAV6SYK0_SOLSE|nr:hypothetical protein JOB18_003358 [Solea senegalensis]KAG7522233.1 hypothetical protein JOB18_017049 [Solea senegalensis]